MLPPPLLGKVPLQFDQSAATVQFAVASFHEQVKFAALGRAPCGCDLEVKEGTAQEVTDRGKVHAFPHAELPGFHRKFNLPVYPALFP